MLQRTHIHNRKFNIIYILHKLILSCNSHKEQPEAPNIQEVTPASINEESEYHWTTLVCDCRKERIQFSYPDNKELFGTTAAA
jgi:hypothetical protein